MASKAKFLPKNTGKITIHKVDLNKFYDGFKKGVQEVKLSLDGKIELKDARIWLSGL